MAIAKRMKSSGTSGNIDWILSTDSRKRGESLIQLTTRFDKIWTTFPLTMVRCFKERREVKRTKALMSFSLVFFVDAFDLKATMIVDDKRIHQNVRNVMITGVNEKEEEEDLKKKKT